MPRMTNITEKTKQIAVKQNHQSIGFGGFAILVVDFFEKCGIICTRNRELFRSVIERSDIYEFPLCRKES